MSRLLDLSGQTFGVWTVVGRAETTPYRQTAWLCQCACGTERVVCAQALRDGRTVSCGCQKTAAIAKALTVHGMAAKDWTAEYRAWMSMRLRCRQANRGHRKAYYDRGITVYEQWEASFNAFLKDMGPIPRAGLTLDRIDNDRGYEPGNCRWADAQQQAINRRSTVNRGGAM